MKDLSRGKSINKNDLLVFIDKLDISEEDKLPLRKLNPSSYIGLASILAKDI